MQVSSKHGAGKKPGKKPTAGKHFGISKGWSPADRAKKKEKVLNHKRKLYASYQRLLKREGIADGKKGSPPTRDDDDDDDANEATRIEDVKADEDSSDDGTGSEGEQQIEHGGEEDGNSSDEEGDGGDEVKPSSCSSGGFKKGRSRPAKPDSLYKAKMIAEAKKKAIEEAKRKRQEKLEARERSEKQRRERYKTMTKKTRRGQPVMKTQLSALLEKIKSTS